MSSQPQLAESRLERLALKLWTRPAWLAPAAIAVCVGAASTYVLASNPTDDQRDALGPCVFKTLTGYDCPGCGGTRMVWYLLHGDLAAAGQHHLMVLLALPFLLYMFVSWTAGRFSVSARRLLPRLRIPGLALAAYGMAFVAFAVLRNVPVEPFTYFYV